MQLQKIQLYIVLMLMSLLCLNGQTENPIAEASDYIEQGREKLSRVTMRVPSPILIAPSR